MVIVIFIFVCFYVINGLYYFRGLAVLKRGLNRGERGNSSYPYTSIIVPAHNESKTIGRCLEHLTVQDYPENQFEIIAINDDSTDNTGDLIEQAAVDPRIIPIHLKRDNQVRSPKKKAIGVGLQRAQGEIIATTDADCIMGKNWLKILIEQFDSDTGMVTGITIYNTKNKLINYFQTLSNSVLSIASVALVANGLPVTCNAANLAYRKKAFEEVGGYSGVDHLISGDDDLLLQKINYFSKWQIKAVIAPDSFVYSDPENSLIEMLNQYSRWGSKGFHYPSLKVRLYLSLLFLSLLCFYLGVIFVSPLLFIAMWLIKFIVDILMAFKLTTILEKKTILLGFLPVYFGQPALAILAVLRGSVGKFKWK